MLNAGDVAAGKLLVQLGFVGADEVRQHLRIVDASQQQGLDLIASLHQAGRLDVAQLKTARRYQAMFDHVRQEAVFLRAVEKRDPPLDQSAVSRVLAQIEADPYRRRMAAVLGELGLLDPAEADRITRKVSRRIAKEDLRVLERYRTQDFSGVERPLLPAKRIETGVFKVSALFRSKATQRRVRTTLNKILEEGLGASPQDRSGIRELLPPDSAVVEDEPSESELKRIRTSRFRSSADLPQLEPTVATEEELGSRKKIGPYEVVECVGQGGMGAVYLVRDDVGSILAVKVMLAQHAAAEDLARFEREIRLMRQVSHRAVVSVLEDGTTPDGLRFVVMPFYTGQDLSGILESGPLEPARVFKIVEQILGALAALHAAGIVHRDLKPENVFVLAGGEDEIRLVDLGIARAMDDALPSEQRAFRSNAGVISGSPAFVAPETIAGAPIDGRTDIYSLGVLLFSLLTGRLPLWGESPYDYLREHLVGVPLSLFQGRKDIRWHEGLEKLVAQMLAKDLDQRPASCEEILGLLQGGLREASLEAMKAEPEEEPEDGNASMFNRFFRRSWF
ncbi:MAG: serine/threonine protein kinase [Planctomycetes bacterium]|nr:serine/threonine protein kinase [Planctomycetota bacterium]